MRACVNLSKFIQNGLKKNVCTLHPLQMFVNLMISLPVALQLLNHFTLKPYTHTNSSRTQKNMATKPSVLGSAVGSAVAYTVNSWILFFKIIFYLQLK